MTKHAIYETLNLSILTDELSYIINNSNIPHTCNQNGTFINISLLDEFHLNILEEYIKEINTKKKNNIININNTVPLTTPKDKQKDITPVKSYQKIKLSNLEQQIISFS